MHNNFVGVFFLLSMYMYVIYFTLNGIRAEKFESAWLTQRQKSKTKNTDNDFKVSKLPDVK